MYAVSVTPSYAIPGVPCSVTNAASSLDRNSDGRMSLPSATVVMTRPQCVASFVSASPYLRMSRSVILSTSGGSDSQRREHTIWSRAGWTSKLTGRAVLPTVVAGLGIRSATSRSAAAGAKDRPVPSSGPVTASSALSKLRGATAWDTPLPRASVRKSSASSRTERSRWKRGQSRNAAASSPRNRSLCARRGPGETKSSSA